MISFSLAGGIAIARVEEKRAYARDKHIGLAKEPARRFQILNCELWELPPRHRVQS